MTPDILWESLEPVLGPLPCQACGGLVIWGVAYQCLPETGGVGLLRRRDLYDVSTEQVHQCVTAKAQAA